MKDPHLRFRAVCRLPVAHEQTQPGILNSVLARRVSDAVTREFTSAAGAQVSKTCISRKPAAILRNLRC